VTADVAAGLAAVVENKVSSFSMVNVLEYSKIGRIFGFILSIRIFGSLLKNCNLKRKQLQLEDHELHRFNYLYAKYNVLNV